MDRYNAGATIGRPQIEVKFYDSINDELLKFAVIISKHKGKWVLCKHKERDTYEIPGGHREENESIINTAKREFHMSLFLCAYTAPIFPCALIL